MSKIGEMPVLLKENVTASLRDRTIHVDGSKGSLSFVLPKGIDVEIIEGRITVSQKNEEREDTKALFGLTRALIANMVEGVNSGFSKKLELSGVGYRAQVQGANLTLSVGFSHPVTVAAPEGITFSVADNIITIFGIDKTLVGDVAAKIRKIRPPEPYKGKGIKYMGERIRRKAGKAAKTVGAK